MSASGNETTIPATEHDRVAVGWGIGAVLLAVSTSVVAAGWFLATRSVSTRSVQVSGSVQTPASVPAPILHSSSTKRTGWIAWGLLAGFVLVVWLPLFTRNTRSAQKVRVWTAAVVGAGAILTIQSIGLLYLPTCFALIMAARTGRYRPPATRFADEPGRCAR
jgi:hypothetical protein